MHHFTMLCLIGSFLQNENQFVLLLSKMRINSCKTIARFTYKFGFCEEIQRDGSTGGWLVRFLHIYFQS